MHVKKRTLALIGGAAVVVAASIAVPLAVITPSKPRALPPNTFFPPTTVDTTCSADDTQSLGMWLLSVPNGTPGHDNVASLKKGACYLVPGSIWWRGPKNIVLNGNGATIKQPLIAPTTPWVTVGSHDIPTVAPYCGSSRYMNSLYSATTSQPSLLSTEGGCDITIENLTIIGTHKRGPDPAPASFYQPASFVDFNGTQRVLVDNVTEKGPYGDFIGITGLHEAPGGGGGMPSTDVTIENSNFLNVGRTGISETNGAHRVLIEDNTLNGANLTMFDIEQDVVFPAYSEEDIDITHNTIVGQNYGYLLAAITGSEIQRIAFSHNTLTDGAQMRLFVRPHVFGGDINNSVTVEGNTGTTATGWPKSAISVYSVSGVLVANNIFPAPTGKVTYPFTSVPKTGVLPCGDRTPAGVAFDEACPAILPVTAAPEPAAPPT